MEQITPTNKNKIKVIVLVIALLIVAGVAAAFFIPSQEERIQNYKEQKREEKIQEKVNQTEGNVSEENNGSSSGDTTGETVSGSVSFGEDYTVATEKDIVYATVNGMSLKIDIYTPIGVTGATPAVLYIHGGGFHGGSKNGVADDSVMLAKHGIASVAIDYRLSGTAVFPAPLHDVKGVARYVKAHASEYNINPDALFTLGDGCNRRQHSTRGNSRRQHWLQQ